MVSGCRRRCERRKATSAAALSRVAVGPRAVSEPGHAWKLHSRERGDPTVASPVDHRSGPRGERRGGNPSMNDGGKSDGLVVPAKPPNNAGAPAAEAVEGRGPAEGNAASKTRPGRRAGQGAPSALGRVRRRAQLDKKARFTALLHHVDVDLLRAAYRALNPRAATGVDEVT